MDGVEFVKELLKNWFNDKWGLVENVANFENVNDINNDIFYVNTCHVCHCLGSEKNLRRCSDCQMISYCGSDHQAKHWPSHKKFCKTVKRIISKNGFSSIFGKTKGIGKENWIKVKMNAMLFVTLHLGRDLTPCEKNMFKFPRNCCVCQETDPKSLTNCLSCGNSSFCQQHISDASHQNFCSSFTSCYTVDLLKNLTDKIPINKIVSILLNSSGIDFVPVSQKNTKFASMHEFLESNFKKIINTRRGKCDAEIYEFFISEYFTRPLTLLAAKEILNFEPEGNMTVHVLGSNFLELNEICAWEVVLHLVPKIQRLKIILIGPELCNDEIKPDLCENCRGRILEVEICNRFYHDFEDEDVNLIVGFNLGISEFENPGSKEDTWKPTILKLAEKRVPFVLTSYTLEEAKKEQERMCYFLGNVTNVFCKNQFSSLKPVRDFETEEIFYQNNYMTVYENLKKV